MQSGLPVFFVRELGALEIFMQKDCFSKPDFSFSPTGNVKNRSYLDRIYMIISSHLQIANQLYFDSGLFIKIKT